MILKRSCTRRATTRIEALIFLVLFCLAAIAAWAIWREPITETNAKLMERAGSFFPRAVVKDGEKNGRLSH